MSQRAERAELWMRAVCEQELSGESVRSFCRRNGLGEHSFYMWRQRLRRQPRQDQQRPGPPPVSFALVHPVPARPAAPASAATPAFVEALLPGGVVLRIPCTPESLDLALPRLLRAEPSPNYPARQTP
jgi:transposase-like protein